MKMTTLCAALSGALLLGAATLAPAQKQPTEPAKAVTPDRMENKRAGISNDEYQREKDRIEADAKAAKQKCEGLKDNAKDICQAEAKGNEKLAKKELDFKKNPNDKNRQDVEKMKAEVAYELAKEKCEDQKGADALNCKKQAKAEKDRAMAAVRGKKVAATDTAGATGARRDTTTTATTTAPAPASTPSTTGADKTSAGTTSTVDRKQNKSGQ